MAQGNGNYPMTDNKREQMVKMYEEGISVLKIAEALSVAPSTIHRNLNKLGIREENAEARKATAHRLSKEQIAAIKELYNAGVRIEDIEEQVGCSRPTIYLHVKSKRGVSDEDVAKAILKYRSGNMTVAQVLQETGLSRATFYRKMKEYDKQEG